MNGPAKTLHSALEDMLERIARTRAMDLSGFPHYAEPRTGEWTVMPDAFWTGGFWVGELWQAAALTGDAATLEAARSWSQRLNPRVDSDTVFRAFLFYYGAARGSDLHADAAARVLAVRAAYSLAKDFDPAAGLIPLGRAAEEAHTVGDDESNIDGMIAATLLYWASRATGDGSLADVARKHALRNAELCVQDDGSVIQSASFDRATRQVTRRYTHKGYADSSIWTRAQAWAMLGYSHCLAYDPGNEKLRSLALQVSDWWIAHLPADGVAFWDFTAPAESAPWKDTSGTAIGSAALLHLAPVCGDAKRAQMYNETARRSIAAMAQDYLTPTSSTDERPRGILTAGCFDPRNSVAVSNELIWGDYFMLECLASLTARA
ncbi:glycosyl hydrolase [Ramlibacter sp.]|uniref:glycosyl hydrolase n=1 Tax=Ramlibacter sp. TaxID=1917967 RepID=UPI003D10A3B1